MPIPAAVSHTRDRRADASDLHSMINHGVAATLLKNASVYDHGNVAPPSGLPADRDRDDIPWSDAADFGGAMADFG